MSDSVLRATIRLVDRGTWTLSDSSDPELVFRTEAFDISVHGGRVYSGVGPGATVIAVPFYYLSRPALKGFDERVVASRRLLSYYLANAAALNTAVSDWATVYLLQILLVILLIAPLYAVFLLRFDRELRRSGASSFQSTLVVLATGLGTMVLFYSSMYSRQALAYLIAWNAVLLWRAAPPKGGRCTVTGLLLGLAVSVDYSAIVLVGVFALATTLRRPWRPLLGLWGGMGGVLLLVAIYHHALFGSILDTPYHHRFWHTPAVLAERGIDLARFQEGPTLGANLPSPGVMFELTFGRYKGLFVYSPVLALGVLGHLRALVKGSPARGEHFFSLAVFILYLALNSTLGTHVTEYGRYFWGGLSVLWGPRYLFATLPFLAYGLVALDGTRRTVRLTAVSLLAVSILFNVLGTSFSHVLMSTFAFSSELDFPVRYVLELFATRGPREPLLDSYGVSPAVQATLFLALTAVTIALWWLRIQRKATAETSSPVEQG